MLVLAVALYTREKPLPSSQEAPIGVSVVFDHGGQQTTEAPPKATPGLPQTAQSPTAPPPPPPPPPQPEVNLGLPQNPLAEMPLPPPQPQRPPQPTRPRQPSPPHYAMMLNGMSYGSPSTAAPATPSHRSLNLDLPQSDAQAVMGPQLSVKGDIGADWMSALNDWVNQHKYYPEQAAAQGQQGSVQIEFTVDRQGNVTGLRMLSSSGSNFLDLAWLGMFKGVKLPPFPPGTTSDHITVDATMQYQLINPGQSQF